MTQDTTKKQTWYIHVHLITYGGYKVPGTVLRAFGNEQDRDDVLSRIDEELKSGSGVIIIDDTRYPITNVASYGPGMGNTSSFYADEWGDE